MITNLEMDRMKSTLFKISSILFLLLVLPIQAFASKTALIYHSNYYDSHTNVKTQLEADGYTVTLSTTGSVHENLFTNNIDGTSGGYDVVYDMKYNNNIGSNGKTRYQNFVQAGGVLILVGENQASYSNTNNTMVAFIENKLGGTVSINGNTTGCSFNCTNNTNSNTITTTNTAVTDSDYGSDVAVYPYGAHFTGDGTWVAKDGNGRIVWMRWSGSQLPSGYTGAAYITFDINQFQTEFDKAKMANLISDTYESILSTVSYSSSISSSQTTQMTTSRSVTHSGNGIYINQVGTSNSLTIVQDGDNNLIAGAGSTTNSLATADIQGNNNTTTLKQKGDNNVMLFDITGNSNTTTVDQGSTSGANDNRVEFDINGDSNILSITQNHNNGVGNNGHFLALDLDGDNNNVLTSQLNDGDKKAFLSVQGNDNDIDLYQQGAGSHFADITVGSNQTVDIVQDGSGQHNTTVSMSGYSATLDLDQSGSTNQTYSINQNCLNANGCGTTTVNQQ